MPRATRTVDTTKAVNIAGTKVKTIEPQISTANGRSNNHNNGTNNHSNTNTNSNSNNNNSNNNPNNEPNTNNNTHNFINISNKKSKRIGAINNTTSSSSTVITTTTTNTSNTNIKFCFGKINNNDFL